MEKSEPLFEYSPRIPYILPSIPLLIPVFLTIAVLQEEVMQSVGLVVIFGSLVIGGGLSLVFFLMVRKANKHRHIRVTDAGEFQSTIPTQFSVAAKDTKRITIRPSRPTKITVEAKSGKTKTTIIGKNMPEHLVNELVTILRKQHFFVEVL